MAFFGELRRRNVFRVATLYIVASWLILQVTDVLFDTLELPPTWARLVLAILMLGFPGLRTHSRRTEARERSRSFLLVSACHREAPRLHHYRICRDGATRVCD